MTEKEAIEYIDSIHWARRHSCLDGERVLMRALGEPQKRLKFVHVAGSNGKGSTCAMLDAILRAAGYRVGLYTSPYIEVFNERIRVDGENIPGQRLAEITERVRTIVDTMTEEPPSQFEVVTAIAMEYFMEQHCDIVVLEVGMGGAYDATNVIDPPEAAVIMNIGLEHTEILGNTLEEIAAVKSGIIKTGSAAVCYDGAPEVTEVVRKVCAERGVPLRCVNFGRMTEARETLDGQSFLWDGAPMRVRLLGPHQLHNTCAVLETVEVLRERGWRISDAAVQEGLDKVWWPARLEVLGRDPLFLLDSGHNPQCAEALAAAVERLLPGKKAVFLLGVLADKDYASIMAQVIPCAKEFICLTPVSDRALSAEDLSAYLNAQGACARPCGGDMEAGIRMALESAGKDGAVVAFGSLYLAGHVRMTYRELFG